MNAKDNQGTVQAAENGQEDSRLLPSGDLSLAIHAVPAGDSSSPQIDPCIRTSGLGDGISELPSSLSLPRNKIVTVTVVAGPSRGLAHRLVKPLVSIGRMGGGADIQLADPQASYMHCAVGVKDEMIRICDLDSLNGTLINGERVCSAGLEHLSEFQVGRSLLVISILPAQAVASGEPEEVDTDGLRPSANQ